MSLSDLSSILGLSEKPEEKPKEKSKPAEPVKENQTTKTDNDAGEAWGYDLYPERKKAREKSVLANLAAGKGRDNIDKIRCERNVYQCIKNSPLVKLMMNALKSSGCTVDIRRHIACEECDRTVSGGYDPVLNQIVVCQNMATTEGLIQGILTHEMVHMFDYCRNNLDFKNIDHLACTEIRAANLTHCSFISAWMQGDVSIFNIRQAHQLCVKNKALASVLAVRCCSKVEAIDAVERVFDRCYNDMEPIGRRLRRGSDDIYKAYEEGYLYGYE